MAKCSRSLSESRGRWPLRWPLRESASKVMNEATIVPFDRNRAVGPRSKRASRTPGPGCTPGRTADVRTAHRLGRSTRRRRHQARAQSQLLPATSRADMKITICGWVLTSQLIVFVPAGRALSRLLQAAASRLCWRWCRTCRRSERGTIPGPRRGGWRWGRALGPGLAEWYRSHGPAGACRRSWDGRPTGHPTPWPWRPRGTTTGRDRRDRPGDHLSRPCVSLIFTPASSSRDRMVRADVANLTAIRSVDHPCFS